ncbi:hypothetical protein BC939DRAFT_204031 [Gamsiella multidivaricata]|uniref:uncharacterized protein n=1 Tax=Gamsiella multidivaricata TaxID=101098 RepID=UPI00221FA2B7|nr:uncharacterized protein BC939DRAFT_204031 [Gamsiella multidivaricata]KAI7821508.1 hypothetical protein BC939DRAFT_204031 [Gamsiella multidivaricata]
MLCRLLTRFSCKSECILFFFVDWFVYVRQENDPRPPLFHRRHWERHVKAPLCACRSAVWLAIDSSPDAHLAQGVFLFFSFSPVSTFLRNSCAPFNTAHTYNIHIHTCTHTHTHAHTHALYRLQFSISRTLPSTDISCLPDLLFSRPSTIPFPRGIVFCPKQRYIIYTHIPLLKEKKIARGTLPRLKHSTQTFTHTRIHIYTYTYIYTFLSVIAIATLHAMSRRCIQTHRIHFASVVQLIEGGNFKAGRTQ